MHKFVALGDTRLFTLPLEGACAVICQLMRDWRGISKHLGKIDSKGKQRHFPPLRTKKGRCTWLCSSMWFTSTGKKKIVLLPSSWPVPLLFLGRGGTRGAAGGQEGMWNVKTQLRTQSGQRGAKRERKLLQKRSQTRDSSERPQAGVPDAEWISVPRIKAVGEQPLCLFSYYFVYQHDLLLSLNRELPALCASS